MHMDRMMHGGHKNPIREKWQKMSLKERREFMRKHHCHGKFFGMEGFDENYGENCDEERSEDRDEQENEQG